MNNYAKPTADRPSLLFREDEAELAQTKQSLRESEERLRLLMEAAQEYAVFMLDPGGHIMTWNQGAERNLGYRAEEILGRHFSCFFPPEDIARSKPESELQRARAEGRCDDEGWRERKEGSRFWARVVITPLHDSAGRLRGFGKVIRDITEGMRAQERFHQAVESAPNGMVMINPEGKIVLLNAQTEKLFGYGREELLGQPVELLIPERFRTSHPEFRSTFFASPQVRSMGGGRDLHGRRKDGSEFPVEIGLNPIKTDQGFLVLSAIVDITERKQTEEALRESETRYRFLFERNLAGVLVTRMEGTILEANDAAAQILGVGTRDAFRGRQILDFCFDPVEWAALTQTVVEKGFVTSHEIRFHRPDGQLVWTLGNISLLQDGSSRQVFHSTLFDITERKRAEEALQRLNAELEQGFHRLGEVNRELKARTQENEAFVYSVSHDLRAPLVNLQGFSRELSRAVQDLRNQLQAPELPQSIRDRQMSVLDGPMARSIHFIQTAVTRLGNIMDALLRLSRAGRVIYQRQPVDVQMIVAHVIASLRGTTEERGAILATGDLPPALGDPAAIEQVFANLIGNALNYLDSKRTGHIEVGNRGPDPSNTQLSIYYIQDNGLGITETGRAKIFQPFQRLHPHAAAGEGMGLAIVQRVIERHGGKIWFESTAGKGSTFFVALPASAKGDSSACLPSASPALEQRSQRE